MDIKERVQKEIPEIIKNLSELVAVPSIEAPAEGNYPFGKENGRVLAKALAILDGYGFKTKNLDNYAGYGEIGSGSQLVGVVGHLDVVPVSSGWTSDPFTLVQKDGNLYGRGSSDDKGPVCCAMAALRIVNELRPDMKKRIRLVMGCNEESGSRGLAHYVQKEGDFDLGFTPDGAFPGVYGEKGGINARFIAKASHIHSIVGGDAPNVVAGEVTMTIDKDSFNEGKFKIALNSRNIKYDIKNDDKLSTITVYGVKAHASLPDMGTNAISEAFVALGEAGLDEPLVSFYNRYIGLTCHGERMGIDQHDQYGDLTFNVGLIWLDKGQIMGTIDIRFPVTKDPQQMEKEFTKATKDDPDGKIVIDHVTKPLYFPPDSKLVKALLASYQKVTGDMTTLPMTMGGGTYAKGIKNTIAFGAEFPDDPDIHMHGDDEFIPVANLAKQTEIYVEALLNLLDI